MSLQSLSVHRIAIERDFAGGTSDGAGGYPENWRTMVASQPARVRPATAREQAQWKGLPAMLSHIVYIPAPVPDITERDRIRFGARLLAIRGVRNPDELGRYLIVECEEVR